MHWQYRFHNCLHPKIWLDVETRTKIPKNGLQNYNYLLYMFLIPNHTFCKTVPTVLYIQYNIQN